MRTTAVNRDEFIERVTQNRDNHRWVFEEALDGYRNRLTAELERRVRDLKRGRHVNQYVGLPEPAASPNGALPGQSANEPNFTLPRS